MSLDDAAAGCLLPSGSLMSGPAAAPLFDVPSYSNCLNMSCLRLEPSFAPGSDRAEDGSHERSGGTRALGEMTPPDGVAGWSCVSASDAETRELIEAAFRWSLPLVLRGCALDMPAVRRWANVHFNLHVEGTPAEGGHVATALENLDESIGRATRWESPFSRQLQSFGGQGSQTIWIARGGNQGDAHYDAWDNLHVVAVGTKLFRLVAPEHAAYLYYDYAHLRAGLSASEEVVCPSRRTYGCDNLGCFAYAPFNASRVDLHQFPRVADVPVLETTLHAGDVLVLPAFYTHHVLCRSAAAKQCVAITYVRQDPAVVRAGMRPLSSDLVRWGRTRAAGRDADPLWHKWLGRTSARGLESVETECHAEQ